MNIKSLSVIKRIKGFLGKTHCVLTCLLAITVVTAVCLESFYSSIYFREECPILFFALVPVFLQVLAVTLTQAQKERAGNGLQTALQIIKIIISLPVAAVAAFMCVLATSTNADSYYSFLEIPMLDMFNINVREISIESIVASFAILAAGAFMAVLHAIFYLSFLSTTRKIYKNIYKKTGLRFFGWLSLLIALLQAVVYSLQIVEYSNYSGKANSFLGAFSVFDWFVTAVNAEILLSMLLLAIIAFRTYSAISRIPDEEITSDNATEVSSVLPISSEQHDDSSKEEVLDYSLEDRSNSNLQDVPDEPVELSENDVISDDVIEGQDVFNDDSPAHEQEFIGDTIDQFDADEIITDDTIPEDFSDSVEESNNQNNVMPSDTTFTDEKMSQIPVMPFIGPKITDINAPQRIGGSSCLDYGYSENEII